MSRDEGPILELVQPYLSGAKLSGNGRNINARCPFHDDHTASFSMHAQSGLWICGSSSCGKSGGLTSFLRLVGVPGYVIKTKTKDLSQRLKVYKEERARQIENRFRVGDPFRAEHILPEGILGLFYMKPLDLVRLGFDPRILKEYDIGFDRSNDRITFPIRDLYGTLTAISGRATIPGDSPRYLVYSRGYDTKVSGITVHVPGPFGDEFDATFPKYVGANRRCVWNADRVYARILNGEIIEDVIIVEGFKVALWMIQHGYVNTVATMGTRVGLTQYDVFSRIIRKRAVLLFDNDPAGEAATKEVGRELIRRGITVHVMILPPGVAQADRMDQRELARAYQAQKEYMSWLLG